MQAEFKRLREAVVEVKVVALTEADAHVLTPEFLGNVSVVDACIVKTVCGLSYYKK